MNFLVFWTKDNIFRIRRIWIYSLEKMVQTKVQKLKETLEKNLEIYILCWNSNKTYPEFLALMLIYLK